MTATATEESFLLILSLRDGKKRVVVQHGRRDGTSMQLLRILRGELAHVELIDSAGQCFPEVECTPRGLDWNVYLRCGYLAPLVFILNLLCLTVMIRVAFELRKAPTVLSLSEMKSKVITAIRSNPRIYTHAPVESILGRIRVARNPESLIAFIGRD